MGIICNELQAALATRYDLRLPCQVQDFICHDSKLIAQITGNEKHGSEVLLVRQQQDELDVTLFLEKRLLDSAKSVTQPLQNAEEFDDYYTVLEGVSHFVYLIWNAQYGRQIKAIDMELQAEVDKFVFAATARNYCTEQFKGHYSKRNIKQYENLEHLMFHDVKFFEQNDSSVEQRYRTANDFAARYCNWLTHQYQLTEKNPQLYAELARFYRRGSREKFEYINQINAH